MTTNHHTPLVNGQPANASTLNSPLSELDSVISNIIAGAISITDLTVTGDIEATNIDLSGDVDAVNGDFTGNITAVDITASDDVIVGDDLSVTGDTTLTNASLSGTLGVTGATTLGAATINGALQVNSTLSAPSTTTLSGTNNFSGTNNITGPLNLGAPTTLTISSGAVTITKGYHFIDTESAASTDDLDTINGGVDGSILVIKPVSSARRVVLKHNTGNIHLPSGKDIVLDSPDVFTILIRNASDWTIYKPRGGMDAGYFITATISSGAITATHTAMTVDTEGAAASDNLDTINGGYEGMIIFIKQANDARDITIRHNVGNIKTLSAADVALTTASQVIGFIFDGTSWLHYAGGPSTGSGDFKLIASGNLSSAAQTVISSIPSSYKSLRLLIYAREGSGSAGTLAIRVGNGTEDTTAANYSRTSTNTNSTTPAYTADIGAVANLLVNCELVSSSFPNQYGITELNFIQAPAVGAASEGFKWCMYTHSVRVGGASTDLRRVNGGGQWNVVDTSINVITIQSSTGAAFASNSRYYLYGMS